VRGRGYTSWGDYSVLHLHDHHRVERTRERACYNIEPGVHYRWKYGGYLRAGFKMLQTHDIGPRKYRNLARAFRYDWLDRAEVAATSSDPDFRLTGPFARYCLCHGRFLDGLMCVVTSKEVKRWAVADAKSRVLCEANVDHGAVWFPDEVMYLWAPE
jgi:hypothetical protein